MIDRPAEIPDRVSIERNSPHYSPWCSKIGVKIDGVVTFSCAEFCVTEGWVKMLIRDYRGNFKQERGKLLTIMRQGVKVEPYWR